MEKKRKKESNLFFKCNNHSIRKKPTHWWPANRERWEEMQKQNFLSVLPLINTWDAHIRKKSSENFAIFRIKNIFPSFAKRTLYKSLFGSHLNYTACFAGLGKAEQTWPPFNATKKKLLETSVERTSENILTQYSNLKIS